MASRVNQNFFSSRVQRTQTQKTVRTQPCFLESVPHGRSQVTCMAPCPKREQEEEASKAWSMNYRCWSRTCLSSHPPVRLWEGLLLFVYPSLRQRLLLLSLHPCWQTHLCWSPSLWHRAPPALLVPIWAGGPGTAAGPQTHSMSRAAFSGRNGRRLSSWPYFRCSSPTWL